jgi:hypothetical protein
MRSGAGDTTLATAPVAKKAEVMSHFIRIIGPMSSHGNVSKTSFKQKEMDN